MFSIRIIGSTVLALSWLAAGRAHACYMGLAAKDCPKAWDWCAATAIGEACGVCYASLMTDEPFGLKSTGVVAARSEALGATLKARLREVVGTLSWPTDTRRGTRRRAQPTSGRDRVPTFFLTMTLPRASLPSIFLTHAFS